MQGIEIEMMEVTAWFKYEKRTSNRWNKENRNKTRGTKNTKKKKLIQLEDHLFQKNIWIAF